MITKTVWNRAKTDTRIQLVAQAGFRSELGRKMAQRKWDDLDGFVRDCLASTPVSDTISVTVA